MLTSFFAKPDPDADLVLAAREGDPRAFDALVFAGDETEATRRYKRWEAYLVDFEEKTRQFFNRYAGGR